MTYNTGNPIGSTDARDRLDNSENMDIFENSTTLDAHPDRLGVLRKTRKGMELEHNNQISAHESEHDAQIAAHETEHDNQMQSFEIDFDSRLAGMAFTRVGSFTTGATLTDMRQVLILEVSQGGDGHEYGWSGAFPKVVAAGSTPATSGGIGAGAWVDRTDDTLRAEITPSVIESLRRSYAEVGYNLVAGSFETGGTLANANDVLLHKASGKAFSGPAGTVAAGTNPASGGFTDKSIWPIATMQEFNAGAYGLHPNNTGLQNCKALQALSAAVTAAGGGHIIFPQGTYTVGAQTFAGATGKGYSYKAEPSLELLNLDTVSIDLQGTKFVLASGLKFGSFDPVTGDIYNSGSMPFLNYDYRAETGRFFRIEGCKHVTITGSAVFDGADAGRIIGGQWGDTGRQVWEQALYLSGHETLYMDANILITKFCTDAAYIGGKYGDGFFTYVTNLTCLKAGRNCISITGGSNITLEKCTFGQAGQGDSGVASLPLCSVDIETELDKIENISFNNCLFFDSSNGVISEDFNKVHRATFTNCVFLARTTDSVSLYWKVAGTKFIDCKFVGLILTVQGGISSDQLKEDVQFIRCDITNINQDGTQTPGRTGTFALVNSTNTSTIDGVLIRTQFIDCNFKALISDATTGTYRALWLLSAKLKRCNVTITGTTTQHDTILDISNTFIEDMYITNLLDYTGTDTNVRPYVRTSDAKIERLYLTKNLSSVDNLLTMVLENPYLSGGGNYGWYASPGTNYDYSKHVPTEIALGLRKDALYSPNITRRYGGPQILRAVYNLPTSGTFVQGDILFHWDALPGEPFGWQCTTTGTAGSTAVFKVISNIEA